MMSSCLRDSRRGRDNGAADATIAGHLPWVDVLYGKWCDAGGGNGLYGFRRSRLIVEMKWRGKRRCDLNVCVLYGRWNSPRRRPCLIPASLTYDSLMLTTSPINSRLRPRPSAVCWTGGRSVEGCLMRRQQLQQTALSMFSRCYSDTSRRQLLICPSRVITVLVGRRRPYCSPTGDRGLRCGDDWL